MIASHRRFITRRTVTVAAVVTALAVSTLLGSSASAVTAAPATAPGDQAPAATPKAPDPVPALTAASFANPPTTVRPKYRMWVPLAYTEDAELQAEVKQIAAAGAGGIEVAPFGVPGPGNQTTPFLDTYGWGTPLWTHKLQVIIAAANKYKLTVDQNLGPNYPPTVPTVSSVNDPAAAQQITYGQAFVAAGGTFDTTLPAPVKAVPAGASTKLVAVVAARCSVDTCSTQTSGSKLLDQSTVVDLTSQVKDGALAWTAPPGSGTWALLAFYQTADGQVKTGFEATTPNYVIDHLSTTGAKALETFWDKNIFTPATQALLNKMVGPGSIFEDSLELSGNQLWTGDFAAQFQKLRGYSVVDALPALAGAGGQGTATPAFDFTDGSGARIRTDYRQTFSDLYNNQYVASLQTWAVSHKLNYRAQSYGVPIQTGVSAQVVGIPEGESIDFGSPNPYGVEQNYRVVSAGAHAAGTTRISAECCGIFNGAYRSTVAGRDLNQDLTGVPYNNAPAINGNLDTIYKSYAGGVTQQIWHGFPYKDAPKGLATPANSGEGGVWPGYNAWNISGFLNVGEMFGPRLPSWSDYTSVNDNLSRLQLVLRQGQPRLDVGVYYEDLGLTGQSVSAPETPNHFLSDDSATAAGGYTYEYLTPQALQSSAATYTGGHLFPGGSAEKGLVLNNQATISVAGLTRVLTLAKKGLPVFIVGTAPSATPGANNSAADDAAIAAMTGQLQSLPSVSSVATEADLPAALRGNGINAAATPAAPSAAVETVRRSAGATQYYYLYNRSSAAVDQTFNLTGAGKPYQLNTWTGVITPLATYNPTAAGVAVPIHLGAYDVTVIAVSGNPPAGFPKAEGLTVSSSTGTVSFGPNGSLTARSTTAGAVATTLSNGKTVRTAIAAVPAASTLSAWLLTAQSWTPGATQSDTVKTTLPPIAVTADPATGALPAWNTITSPVDLSKASGIGSYTTTITLPNSWTGGHGAYLNLGKAVDTVQISVNGKQVAVNQSDISRIDLGDSLHAGLNIVTVTVSTTLFNAVKTTGDRIYSQASQATGLLGPVVLTPYGQAVIDTGRAVPQIVPGR